jgi:UDP-glucose 4-epimerase
MGRGLLITGASGYWGQSLLRLLRADSPFDPVVGIDLRGPGETFDGYHHRRMDIRDGALGQVLDTYGIDTILHLAFALNVFMDDREVRDINLRGAKNVLDTALVHGIRRFVLASSAAVYGAWRADPTPFREDDPLRGNRDLFYTRDKVDIENLLRDRMEENPDVDFVVLRPVIIAGPSMGNILSWGLTYPMLVPTVLGANPPLQFVHEEDLAHITAALLAGDRRGAYNVAPDEGIPYHDVIRIFGKRPLPMPAAVMKQVLKAGGRFRITCPVEGGVDLIRYPWLVDREKLERDLGYRFRYGSRQALEAVVGGRR